jgi:hypothetical protein
MLRYLFWRGNRGSAASENLKWRLGTVASSQTLLAMTTTPAVKVVQRNDKIVHIAYAENYEDELRRRWYHCKIWTRKSFDEYRRVHRK